MELRGNFFLKRQPPCYDDQHIMNATLDSSKANLAKKTISLTVLMDFPRVDASFLFIRGGQMVWCIRDRKCFEGAEELDSEPHNKKLRISCAIRNLF